MYGGAKLSTKLLRKLFYSQQKLREPKNVIAFRMNLI